MTARRGVTQPTTPRHGKMSARWIRAFAALLALSLTTAVLSVAVVKRVESTFTAATDEASQKTASYDRIADALARESAAAHTVLDYGSGGSGAFRSADQAADAAFTDALSTYDDQAERLLVGQARAQWQDAFYFVRTLAADDDHADEFARATGPQVDAAHRQLGTKTEPIRATLHQLDRRSDSGIRDQAHRAHATTSKLLILLAAIFALSVCATIVYARRMARQVVRPIQTLRESADRFGAGELDHRVDLPNDDEIGELAKRFNVMAETIASTHRHLIVQAHHDVLTGLINRAGFVGRLDAAVDPAGPEAGSVSLMFIDLDDFKNVNDELGHAAGDELLRQVADRLRAATRSADVVCRLGGDEFAILIGNNCGGHLAEEIAQRVLDVLDQPFSVHGALIRIGASIGIASQTDPTDTGEHLLRAADVAMYAAKGQGKHQWERFDPDIHGHVLGDVSLRAYLDLAA